MRATLASWVLSKLPKCSATLYCTAKSMDQLFYNIASGIVHQIWCEKRTTISEVIVQWGELWRHWCRVSFFIVFLFFLPRLITLAQEKKVTKLSLFWNWWAKSLFVPFIVAKYDIFSLLTMAARLKKFLAKRFAHAISVHYRDFEHVYVYWIWLCGSASYVIKENR